MQANKRNLSEILSHDIRLVAPLFQRPYVWGREQNWEPLWQALQEVFERRLEHSNPRPYFLGALVLDQVPNPIGSTPCRELIDGQQRMTTLQIFLEVAKRVFLEERLEHQAAQCQRLTRNELEQQSDEQYKVWPTNVDRAPFKAVMSNEGGSGRMAEAASFFSSVFREWLRAGSKDIRDRANAVIAAVRQDLVFVAIDLDNDDDGQLIFETLNSLGTPLLPSDLVKNFLFRAAVAEKLDTEALYAAHWQMFEQDSTYWRANVRVGRRDRPRLDVFLQHYLAYRIGKESVLAHQFRDYRDAVRDGDFGTVEEAIRDFALHAKLFRKFDEARQGAAGSLRHVLHILDMTVFSPLALAIYANVQHEQEQDAMFRTLESYLIRRFLCCLSIKRYNNIAADLVKTMKRGGWSNETLQRTLLYYEGNSSAWPDDGWVIWRHTQGGKAYGDIRGMGIAYVLSRVEQSLRSGKSELPWIAETSLSIEHLMPQRWEQTWPLDNPDDEHAKRRRYELLDKFGNLTILTQKLNSAVSNSAWDTKRKHLNHHSVLLINSALAEKETWDEAAIEHRNQDLLRRFCELWPRPASPTNMTDSDVENNLQLRT